MSDKEFFNNFSYSYNESNKILKYANRDSIETYKKNLKENKILLEKNNWIDAEIIYSYNNYGFRTPDNFNLENPEEGNVFLGCSILAGNGINIEDTCGYKINRKIGGCFYNLSQSGAGIETMYRLMAAWLPVIKQKNVYIMGLFKNRREFIRKKQQSDGIGNWVLTDDFSQRNNLSKENMFFYEYAYQNYFSGDDEQQIFWHRNWNAIKFIAYENNINLFSVNEEKLKIAFSTMEEKKSFARDCKHPGIIFHEMLSDLDSWDKII